MALRDDFQARFPEFSSSSVGKAWTGLEASWPCYYGIAYGAGSCTDAAILNLIAHLLAVSSSQAPANAVTSQSVGSVSQSFNVPQGSARESFFNSTRYGQAFLMMTQARSGVFFV